MGSAQRFPPEPSNEAGFHFEFSLLGGKLDFKTDTLELILRNPEFDDFHYDSPKAQEIAKQLRLESSQTPISTNVSKRKHDDANEKKTIQVGKKESSHEKATPSSYESELKALAATHRPRFAGTKLNLKKVDIQLKCKVNRQTKKRKNIKELLSATIKNTSEDVIELPPKLDIGALHVRLSSETQKDGINPNIRYSNTYSQI